MKNRDKINESKKEYRMKNLDKIKDSQIKYTLKNNDKIKIRKKEYRMKFNDKIKETDNEYRMNNRAKIQETQYKYRMNNIDKFNEVEKEYRKDKNVNIKEFQKTYRTNNKDKIKEGKKESRVKNLKKFNETQKEYRMNNSDKVKEIQKEYRINKIIEYNPNYIPNYSWKTSEELRLNFESIALLLHIADLSDWYRISFDQIIQIGGGRIISKFGTLGNALIYAYPDYPWDLSKFSLRGKKSTQRWLYFKLKELLPNTDIVEEFSHPDLVWGIKTNVL